MGAWGFAFNENDDAADWLADFGEGPGWPQVSSALQIDQTGYVESDQASQAVAAAEIVAAANGHPHPALAVEIVAWIGNEGGRDEGQRMTGLAAGVVQYLMHHGELAELWGEGDATGWAGEMAGLLQRLTR